jgi:hypothetical protein
MDHEVAIIDQGPAPFLRPLEAELEIAQALHLLVDLFGDRATQPPRGGRDDHEVIDERGRRTEVEQKDVLAPVVVRNPGTHTGMLQRPHQTLGGGSRHRAGKGRVLGVLLAPGDLAFPFGRDRKWYCRRRGGGTHLVRSFGH